MKCTPIHPADFNAVAFWRFVAKGAPDDCWSWVGARDRDGYGQVRQGVRVYRAHRVSYALTFGAIDPALVIDHLCRNTACVNPCHLENTTVQINTARGDGPAAAAAAARLLGQCLNGHVIAEVGEHKQRAGMTCAECGRDRVRRYRQRQAAA